MELESDDCTNCDWCFWHNNKGIIKTPERLGSWRTGRDYPNDSIVENGQNTKKSPEDLRRLAVTQAPVKNYQVTHVKNSKGVKNMIIIIATTTNEYFKRSYDHFLLITVVFLTLVIYFIYSYMTYKSQFSPDMCS